MADFDTLGKALQIPQSVLNNIEKIDQKINLIASDSEKMATHFTSAMTRMNGITGDLIKKLQTIHGLVGGIGNINIGGLNNVNNGLGKTTTEAEKVANAVTEAAIALNRFSKTWQELGARPQVSKSFEILTNREQLNVLKEARNEADAYSRALSEANKKNIAETKVTANAIKEQSQTEKNRHEEKMARLKQEASSVRINSSAYRDYVSAITMSEGTENSRIKKIERMNTVLSELQRKEALYANEIEIVRKKIEQLTRENDSLARSREKTKKQNIDERTNTQALNAYNRAMASSDALVTQRINKIAKLRQAEEMLRNASGNYAAQLNRINQEIARLNKLNQGQVDSYGRVIRSQHNLMNTSQQLARQLALVFSVSAIEGYVTKLIRVRGEFELQNTALAAMLNNKDQADRLFGQITELAVRSPFTIKELTTYTKSLAAYQVQYEDLYDTTKMLADVSAGLGVDMQRLILAFGQVKAANILRGTELRQFTEAGVNMLSELAKYYSELENRMVSVGEVQEMVTKRMVSFGDVEEVFKRITSAGGLFYNMQEKQSDTLRGQMMNLQDQIDLMLNDIGKSNQTTISAIISLVKSVIENWKSIAQVMEPIASVLVLYLTTTKGWSVLVGTLPKLWGKVRNGIQMAILSLTAAGRAQQTFNKAAAGNAWLAIGAVVATIIWEVVNAIKAANEEQQKYNKIVNDGSLKASELGANFERLANQAVKAADGSREQKEALDELSRTYSGILPQDDLKIEKLREMKGAYDGVITAIYNKIEADTKENLLQEVNATYGAEAVESLNNLAKRLEKFGISANKARTIVAEFRKEWDKGNIDATNAFSKLQGIIQDFTGEVYQLTEVGVTSLGDISSNVPIRALNDVVVALTKFGQKRDEILGQDLLPFRVAGGTEIYEQLSKQLKEVSKVKEEWEKENYGKFDMTIEFTEESKKQQIQAYQKFIDDINKKIKSGEITGTNVISAKNVIEDAQDAINKLNVSPMVRQIDELRLKFSQLTGIDFGKLNFTQMMPTDSFEEYIKGIDAVLDGYNKAIKVFDDAKKANEEVPFMQRESLLQGMESEEELRAKAAAVKVFKDAIYYEPPKTTTGGGEDDSEIKRLKEQIKLIQDAGKEYEKYRKLYAEPMAQQLTKEAFTQPFEDVGLSVNMEFDVNGVIAGIRQVIATAGIEGQKIGNEAIAKLMTDSNAEQRTKELESYRKQVDNLFQSLENYKELEKLGLDKDLISQLFGINVSSINDIQSAFDRMKSILKGYGDEGEKLIAEAEKKITQQQQNELNNRLKEYAQMLKKSISERARIELEAQEEIRKVQNTAQLDDVQKRTITQSIRVEADKAKDKAAWEDFQNTDLYIRMFEDLDSVSTRTLNLMQEKLAELRVSLKNLDPQDLKAISEQMEKINEEAISRNPFSGMIDNIKEYIEYRKQANELEDKYNTSVSREDFLKNSIDQQHLAVDAAEKRYIESVKLNGAYSQESILAKANLTIQKKQLDNLLAQLAAQGKITQELADQIRAGEISGDNTNKALSDSISLANEFITMLPSMSSDIEQIFASFSEKGSDAVSSFVDIASSYMQMTQGGANLAMGIMSGNVVQAISGGIQGIQGLFSTIGSLFQIGDKKKEREIQRQIELVEDLQHAYEKLEEAIDNAYSIDQLEASTKQAQNNLEEQAAALEEAIRLEEDKKKTDKDKLKEYQQQLEDVREQQKQLQEEFITEMGGFGSEADVKSAAQEFADAWFEAFNKTGDGLAGLEETFDDYFNNILKKQIMMKATETFLKPLLDQINAIFSDRTLGDYLENYANGTTSSFDGANATIEELDAVREQADKILPLYNEFAKQLMESLGVEPELEGDGDTLTGLQRGIEGLSEQTGQALEALLESIRFFVSDENAVIHNIYNTLTMPTEENPFLIELRLQSQRLGMIYDLWSSLTKTKAGTGGRVLKVEIM